MIWLLRIAMPDPQFVGPLLVPRHRGLGAIDLDVQPVLAACRNLAGGERAARPVAHAEDHRAQIFGVDGDFFVILRAARSCPRKSRWTLGPLARFVERLQVGAERRDAQSGDVLGHVAPVRADIGHAPRRAVGFGIDAPVPVRVVKQPVLRIGALHHQDLAQFARFAHAAHMLHHRVKAQIVEGAVAQLLFARQVNQFFRLVDGGGQRLFADHVLAGQQRILGHRESAAHSGVQT